MSEDRISLRVVCEATGEDYVAECTLPVQMGRAPGSGNQIVFAVSQRAIGRISGVIERTSRGLVWTDTSSNGSRVGGLVVRDSRVALPADFVIEIESYRISSIAGAPAAGAGPEIGAD